MVSGVDWGRPHEETPPDVREDRELPSESGEDFTGRKTGVNQQLKRTNRFIPEIMFECVYSFDCVTLLLLFWLLFFIL